MRTDGQGTSEAGLGGRTWLGRGSVELGRWVRPVLAGYLPRRQAACRPRGSIGLSRSLVQASGRVGLYHLYFA
jgi:hypothetical protein